MATAAGQCRLIPFQFSTTQAYVLEFSNNLIRIYTLGGRLESGGSPVQITTTYTTAELSAIKWAQSADVLYLVHPDHPPAKLERLSATAWRLRDVDFTVPPSVEFGARPTTTVTPGATTGAGVTFTAGAAAFQNADVGREIIVTAGDSLGARAEITGFTNTTTVTCTITEDFANTSAVASGAWKIGESPKTQLTPSAATPVGSTITLTLAANGWRNANGTDVGKFVHVNGGVVEITVFTSALAVDGVVRSELSGTTAAPSGSWSLEEAAWSAANGYPHAVTFTPEDRLGFFATDTEAQTGWLSKTGDYENFAAGAADDDAIQLTLNTDQVNVIAWAKAVDALILGTVGGEFVADAGEGAVLTPANTPVDPKTTHGSTETVPPLTIGNAVLFLTGSRRKLREFVFNLDVNNYLAPDLLLLADHLTKPRRIDGTRTDRSIVDLAYQKEPDSIVWAPRADGTCLAMTYLRDQNVIGWHRHLTGPTEADPDGSQIPSRDKVESVAVIPHPDGDRDQVWWSVARTINSVTARSIEYLDDAGLVYESLHTDATLTLDGTQTTGTLTPGAGATVAGTTGVLFTRSAGSFVTGDVGKELRNLGGAGRATITARNSATEVAATINTAFPSLTAIAAGSWGLASFTISGLTHLVGETVDVVGDGQVYPQETVTAGGAITITPAAVQVEAGLPYTSTMVSLRPEVPTNLGTSQGLKQRAVRAILRVVNAVGGAVNGEPIHYRSAGDTMDEAVPARTGDADVLVSQGWDTEGRLTVTQDQPLPLTVVFLSGLQNVGTD